MLISAVYNAKGFKVTFAPEEYWVYGVDQAVLMEIIKEHLNLTKAYS